MSKFKMFFVIMLMCAVFSANLSTCESPVFRSTRGSYDYIDGLNNTITGNTTFEVSSSDYTTEIKAKLGISSYTIDKILKRHETNGDRYYFLLAHSGSYYKAIYQYSTGNQSHNEVVEIPNLIKTVSSDGVEVYESANKNWTSNLGDDKGRIKFGFVNDTVVLPFYVFMPSAVGGNDYVKFLIMSLDNTEINVFGYYGSSAYARKVNSTQNNGLYSFTVPDSNSLKVAYGYSNSTTEDVDLMQSITSSTEYILLNDVNLYTCNDVNVNFRSSRGTGDCGYLQPINATCIVTSEDTGETQVVNINTDQSEEVSTTLEITSYTITNVEQFVMSGTTKSRKGGLRPFDACWEADQIGATGLGGLQVEVVTNDENVQGLKPYLMTENARLPTLPFNADVDWFKGRNNQGLLGDIDRPGIMAGKYATPITFFMSPDTMQFDVNVVEVDWRIAPESVTAEAMLNQFGSVTEDVWKDNNFYVAFAVNTTHYLQTNITHVDGYYNKTAQANVTWTELNSTLVNYGVTIASITELLSTNDFSQPVEVIGNSLKVRAYIWGEIENSTNSAWQSPSCIVGSANENAIMEFNCDSHLVDTNIKSGTHPSYDDICNIPVGEVTTFGLMTPGFVVYPTLTTNVTKNSYTDGTVTLPASGTYNYSCTNNFGQEISDSFYITGDYAEVDLIYGQDSNPVNFTIKTIDRKGNVKPFIQTKIYNSTDSLLFARQSDENGEINLYNLPASSTYIIEIGKGLDRYNNTAILGDSENSQNFLREYETGHCQSFNGTYFYEVIVDPVLIPKEWTITCGSAIVPSATLTIDNNFKGISNENGDVSFSVVNDDRRSDGDYFTVTVTSEYGNRSTTMSQIRNDYSFNLRNCDESELIKDGNTALIPIDDFFEKLGNPYVIGFLLWAGAVAYIWLQTGNNQIALVSGIGMSVILFYLQLLPLFAMIIVVAGISLALAMELRKG